MLALTEDRQMFPTMIVNYNDWFADDLYCDRMCALALDVPVDAIVARNPASKRMEVLAVNDQITEVCEEIITELASFIREELKQ
jgi:hypothetical protein